MYQASIDDPDKFWAEQASIKWFEGAELNVSYNCIDRHLPDKANQTAIYSQTII